MSFSKISLALHPIVLHPTAVVFTPLTDLCGQMMKENHELAESNAKMVDQVHTAKQDALK